MPDLRYGSSDADWNRVSSPRLITVLVTVIAMLGSALLLWNALSWTQRSIISGTLALLPISDRAANNVLMVCLSLYLFLIYRMMTRKSTGGGAGWPGSLGPAVSEELWFRAGCERWTWGQRVYSCVTFGFLHLTNLVIPLSIALVLTCGGAVFMWVYLREYKRTQCVTVATLASSRFHAMYNEKYFFVVLPVAVVGQLVYSFVYE